MKNFNVSTNIIRDKDTLIDYIVTRNSSDNFDRIISNYNNNNKFQAIIGSYGTGKSSFLWAFEQHLLEKNTFFSTLNKEALGGDTFDFISLIGVFNSLSVSLAKALKIKNVDDNSLNIEDVVLSELERLIKRNTKKKTITVLIIDEFGKFLEYAVQNNPDKEVYFIQQLAELFNDPKKLALSICTLHQNFSSYGQSLTKEQFKEWEKVKGRMKEVPFNEPIDQLLYFASERNSFKNLSLNGDSLKLFNLIKKHNVSDKKQILDTSLAQKLLPLDYISAEVLTKSLQRYGQNERSLFTFLDVDESFSFKRFYNQSVTDSKPPTTFSLSEVYDYIYEHYLYVLTSNTNLDLTHWNAIKSALDQVDTRLDTKYINSGRKIIKTIGLLNIFTHLGSKIDEKFLVSYAELALEIKEATHIVKKLISQKIISYKNYKHRYVFVDWTDINIDHELDIASNKIRKVTNTSERISELGNINPILVKKYYFKTGTPRIFTHKSSNECLVELPEDSDALINYVFSKTGEITSAIDLPIIYAVFNNTNEINDLLFDIDKAKKVKEENREDLSAIKELDERIFYSEQNLQNILFKDIYSSSDVSWFYNGKKRTINNKSHLNALLNEVLDAHYVLAPVLKSELINKSKLSTPISTARRRLISQLLDNEDKKDLDFDKNKFPPEKTIYLSLIKATGIHKLNSDTGFYEYGTPDFNKDEFTKSYKTLWDLSIRFLEDSKEDKKLVKDLYDTLSSSPLKLKKGIIDFWVPIFLIVKNEDYALFNADGYIPNIDKGVFDVMYKSPHKFWVKAFDISGIKLTVFNKYKSLLNRKNTDKASEKDFINTIKPFILFTRTLNNYALNTKNLSPQTIALREAINKAKDPQKAFFEDFPKALNYAEALEKEDVNMLEGFVQKMKGSIDEMKVSYQELLSRFEDKIITVLSESNIEFAIYQDLLLNRLSSINPDLLNSRLRNIYRKCTNPTKEKNKFLEGIAYAVLNKSLENINDDEEEILHKDFELNYKKLLSLVDIHTIKSTHTNDAVFSIKIFNESGKDIERKAIVPLKANVEVQKMYDKINDSFNGMSVDLKKAVLIKLLEEETNE